jgi:Ca2+-binding EF-hand superfamily protein
MNGINGIGMGMYPGMSGMQRPSPQQSAESLFSELDSSGQGYIEQSDLQSAFDKISSLSSTSAAESDDTDVAELFDQLDTDGDGKVTQQEFTDSLAQIDEQMQAIFSELRQDEAMGMMPPPPPPPAEENSGEEMGFTKDELTAQLEEIGSSDSERASLIESIIENFDEADTDGDGRVNLQEAMAFDSDNSETDATASSDTLNVSSDDTSQSLNDQVALQLMRLLDAYNLGANSDSDNASTLSVSA